MELKDFTTKVEKAVGEVLGDEYQIRTQEVLKNNGTKLMGLMIRKESQNVAPTIYLNGYHERYEEGEIFGDVMQSILADFNRGSVSRDVDISFFEHFEEVKDRICFRLINTERNEDLLQDIPNIPFLDLSIVFFYAYHGEEIGDGSILIHNNHMERWQTNTEELMKLALRNTPELFQSEIQSMLETMKALVGDNPAVLADAANSPMTIISNQRRVNGASAILYPRVLHELSEKEGSNLYLLPSSVHEVIALPENLVPDADFLRQLICEVNRTQVHAPEVLSDTLYFYDRSEGKVRIA
jgi:hypothetical protein